MADSATPTPNVKYSKVVCIGMGLSGMCLGAQLRMKWDFKDMHFYDRNESHSGTWLENHYPGAGCDVPVIFYSFSFAQGQPWSRFQPGYDELRDYASRMMSEYDLERYATYRTVCEEAIWDENRFLWSLHMRNLVSGEKFIHECSILISAVGLFNQPYIPTIPGAETFQGESLHTARWRDEVSLVEKDVVVLGNGCSASQLVPAITSNAKTVTQIIRSSQWLFFFDNLRLSPVFLKIMRTIPLLTTLLRCFAFVYLEFGWLTFMMNSLGERRRNVHEKAGRKYILTKAPEKYHDILTPDYAAGCKRQIYDSNGAYFKALHSDKVFPTKETVIEIQSNGILTDKRFYPADVIVYATGFKTENTLGQIRIKGENGMELDEYWNKGGGASAYNTVAVTGYPNFFILFGPNSAMGHTSSLLAVENAVDGILRLITPLLKGRATKIAVKEAAYEKWTAAVQATSKTRVFSKEICRNWYNSESGWNNNLFPWSQIYFWWRQRFPIRSDWEYTVHGLLLNCRESLGGFTYHFDLPVRQTLRR